jgi:hypothetical protein
VVAARRGTDEDPIRSASVAVRAVRRRLDDPTAVAGLDEIADLRPHRQIVVQPLVTRVTKVSFV